MFLGSKINSGDQQWHGVSSTWDETARIYVVVPPTIAGMEPSNKVFSLNEENVYKMHSSA